MSRVSENEVVLLIGASRGLGHAIAAEYINRGSEVVATVRGPARTALHELQETAGGRLEIEHVDINAPEQVHALRDRLGSRRFDLAASHGAWLGPDRAWRSRCSSHHRREHSQPRRDHRRPTRPWRPAISRLPRPNRRLVSGGAYPADRWAQNQPPYRHRIIEACRLNSSSDGPCSRWHQAFLARPVLGDEPADPISPVNGELPVTESGRRPSRRLPLPHDRVPVQPTTPWSHSRVPRIQWRPGGDRP